GVTTDRIADMAKMAPNDPTAGGNPVELTEEAAAMLFEQVI
ncbi:MAG: alcohol dehydrogenase, partial [Pseudomonadota bacterium]